jgi:hypothetical protein
MIRLKLNLRKLNGFRTFTGKDGIEYAAFPIKANAIYMTEKSASMDVTLLTNRDGTDKYGNDGFCTVDLGKERRLAGEKGPILGNWKDLDGQSGAGRDIAAKDATYRGNKSAPQEEDDSSIPF